MHDGFALLVNLSISLALALALGLVTERLRLSPIVGYLLAGVALGPKTPGIFGDVEMAQQFAEIGVVLLMFGVGLHFNLRDLLAVRNVALPGAVGQIAAATMLGAAVVVALGGNLAEGLVIGVAISVASTVVLVRVLTDNDVLDTPQGHIAVGWLIVEDVFTVLVLVVLPALAGARVGDGGEGASALWALAAAIGKIGLLTFLILGGGKRLIPWLLGHVARTRSRELFTLSVLALALAIATGSAVLFGVSMALGAFLAGMVVGHSEVSHQAAADALPMRDAFAVLFFVSVGMLFDPKSVTESPWLLLALLSVILVAKPLVALVIVWGLRYSLRTGLTIAIALAQIGEFSFLLADEAMRLHVLSAEGQSLLVACALISITLNPLLFRAIDPLEKWLRRRPRLWECISRRAATGGAEMNEETRRRMAAGSDESRQKAVVVGYGPVGQTASRILRDFQLEPVIIDLNLDTVRGLSAAGGFAVYGDATRRHILEAAGIREAKYLLVTVPDVLVRTGVILTAKEVNPRVRIFARARYLQERAWLEEIGTTQVCTEEAETAVGLAVLLLREVGADEARIRDEIRIIQTELGLRSRDVERGPSGKH
jgi:CPA2 family monovalent cation:H+ antiporter-2